MAVLKIRDADGNVQELLVIKGNKGDKGENGYTPVKGVDYFTEADKSEIVLEVLAQIPSSEGVDY